MATTIIHVELALPTPSDHDAIGDQSWFLRAAASFPDRIVLAFGAPGYKKDESMGRLFAELEPIEDRGYEIELAAILHERLPGPQGDMEYVVSVAKTEAIDQRFCLSNIMNMVRYRQNGTDRHAILNATASSRFLQEHREDVGETAHVEFIPSVVTARYFLNGTNADDALSERLEATVDDFIGGINRLVASLLVSTDPGGLPILTSAYDRGSFPWIYMLVRGSGDKFAAQRLATSLLRTSLVPHPLPPDRWAAFLDIAAGRRELDPAKKALRSAQSAIQAGALDFALLLTAVAIEVSTTQYVTARLREEGVSNSKLGEVKTDLTFNVMLNTQIVALTPADRKPEATLMGTMNRVRKLRNDYMHYGLFDVTRDEVVRLVSEAEQYVSYLASLAATSA